MSSIPANIEVTFQAAMIGQHRVCYRLGESGSYTCILVNCLAVGECVADISIFVDNETCDEVTYTGYVQAACIEEASSQDRVPFEVTFTPVPSCKSYNIRCYLLGIASITITAGGTGYTPGSPPPVQLLGAGNATGIATVGSGGIASPVITNPGAAYVDGIHTNVAVVGGTGTGAKVTAVVSGGVVISITVTTPGSGYSEGDSCTLNNTDMGGAPAVLVAFTVSSDYGTVISIAVTNVVPFGSPVNVIIGPGLTQAMGEAVMEDCPAISSPGCSGSDIEIAAGSIAFLEGVVVCGYTSPSQDSAYEVTETGNCLCGCTTATIGVSGSVGQQVRYFYNKCGLEPRNGVLTVGGSPSQVIDCIVAGSLAFQIIDTGAEGTVSYGDDCP